jgi:hypothetical protein
MTSKPACPAQIPTSRRACSHLANSCFSLRFKALRFKVTPVASNCPHAIGRTDLRHNQYAPHHTTQPAPRSWETVRGNRLRNFQGTDHCQPTGLPSACPLHRSPNGVRRTLRTTPRIPGGRIPAVHPHRTDVRRNHGGHPVASDPERRNANHIDDPNRTLERVGLLQSGCPCTAPAGEARFAGSIFSRPAELPGFPIKKSMSIRAAFPQSSQHVTHFLKIAKS